MYPVSPTRPRSLLPRRLRRAATALAVAACAASLPSEAGQASAAFQITIEVVPQGSNACTASTGSGSAEVTCRPTVVGPAAPTPVVGGGGERSPSALLGYHLPDPSTRLTHAAGAMVEVGGENHYAWGENNFLAWGEYSSRLISAGGVEYVEMTLTW